MTPQNGSLNDQQIKHLEFIQGVVTRLGNSSFLIKGWAMTVAGAFFGIAASRLSWKLTLTAAVPIVGFWLLDAYYLRQERLFRKLYDDVRNPASQVSPFSMNIGPYHPLVKWPDVVKSHTLAVFYGLLLLVDLIFTIGGIVKAVAK